MASPLLAPGQSMAVARNSVTPTLYPASSTSSSLCAFSSQSGVAFPCRCIIPSYCRSTFAGFPPSLFPSMGSSYNQRPARASKALLLHSVFVSRSLDSSFFNGGAGFQEIAGMMVFVNISLNNMRGGALGASMNIFDRVARVFRSYVNAIVSAAEDPEKILEQTVLEMNDDLRKMRQASAQVLASQKLLENKSKAAQQNADDWYRRAKLALQRGEEDLAREALKRRKSYEDTAIALQSQLEQQKTVSEKIISNTRLLESKIQEAKSKKDTLKARAQSAKTASKVTGMLGSIDTSSALAAFERMEEKVNALEAEADALNQISTDDLSVKFRLMESDSVDDDLTSLKKEMLGTSKRPDELPAGRSPVSSASSSPTAAYPFRDIEIEKELNDLRRKASEF